MSVDAAYRALEEALGTKQWEDVDPQSLLKLIAQEYLAVKDTYLRVLAEYNADVESLVEKLQTAQAEGLKMHERVMSLEDHVMRLEQNLLEAGTLLKYANPKAKDPVVQRRWKEARRRVAFEGGRPVR